MKTIFLMFALLLPYSNAQKTNPQPTKPPKQIVLTADQVQGFVAATLNGTFIQIDHKNSGQAKRLSTRRTGKGGVPITLARTVQSYCQTQANATICYDDFLKKMYKHLQKDKHGNVYYRSMIRWGSNLKRQNPRLRDQLLYVPIVGKNVPGPIGVRHFVINNLRTRIDSRSLKIKMVGNNLIFELNLASNKPTIIWGGRAPDVNIQRPKLGITFYNVKAVNGVVTYSSAKANMYGDVDLVGAYRIIEPFVERRIKREIANQITNVMNSYAVRQAIGSSISSAVQRAGRLSSGQSFSAQVKNSRLVINY